MRNNFIATNMKRFVIFEYGKVVFLFVLMSACLASSIFAGEVGQASLPDIAKTTGDACPTREELITKTKTLQIPFIANNGQVDEQVKFYAKTLGGTVFVTNDGEIVYALPEVRGRDVPAGASLRGRRWAEEQGGKVVSGWRGQALLVRAESEFVANGYLPLFLADNANCPPDRVLTKLLFAAYLPELQEETTQRIVSTPPNSNSNVLPANYHPHSAIQNPQSPIKGVALKETLPGAKIRGITGEQPAVTTVNYFTGNDKSKWKTNVPTYNRVSLGEVYQGIELSLKAYGDNVEKLFCVKPGGRPEFIKVQLDGGKSLRINQDGRLEAETVLGTVAFTKPIAYQEVDGKRVEVACEYTIAECVKSLEFGFWNLNYFPYSAFRIPKSTNSDFKNPQSKIENPKFEYGFTVASYDKTKDLIIDPLLASTFLGGSGYEEGNFLTLDTSGNVYVTGYTGSDDFPTTSGAYDTSFGGRDDVFVSKLDGELTSLLASTYLGGAGLDYGYSLTLDTSGNVYVTGYTGSDDFPTTSGAYNTSHNGGYYDVFVSKLDSGLTSLLTSTYLGGAGQDIGNSLTLDTSGNVYVTGYTGSDDFPTTSGAYDTSFNGGWMHVFISKLNSGLTSLLASTYLGGSNVDVGNSLSLDTSGNVYVTGETWSSDFPTTSGAYDTSLYDSVDVFVSKLNNGLTSLLASTYLGGADVDSGKSLTLDTSGNVYVTGWTNSEMFPTTSGAYDTSYNGNNDFYGGDVFVSKLDGGLTSLLASTFLGGSSDEVGYSLTLDTSGNVYVAGYTYSGDFPTTSGAYDTSFNGGDRDVFVSKLDSELTSLPASTFLGGADWDEGYFLTLDTSGNVYVTGWTGSSDFPTTSGVYDTSYNGSGDVFVSKLDGNLSADVSSCKYTILPTRKSFSSRGGFGGVRVKAKNGCSWTAVSNAAWITVVAGSGTGNGPVAYSVSANTGTSARTGTVTIAGKTFTVKQARGK